MKQTLSLANCLGRRFNNHLSESRGCNGKAEHKLEQTLGVFGSCELNPLSGSFHPCDSTNVSSFEACIATPPASQWVLSRSRRLLDIAISLIVLLLAAAPMLLLAACVQLTSRGNVIFPQGRVGVGGRLFKVYKFRSMAHTASEKTGPGLTKDGDCRVTPIGRLMRRFKLDELPQFYNVLRGDMSVVGPRPKLPKYAALLNMPYRPGITGPATLAFHREEELLSSIETSELESFYAREIKPVKAILDACYMCHATPISDARIVGATALGCLHLDLAVLRLPAALLQKRSTMNQPARASGATQGAFGMVPQAAHTRSPHPVFPSPEHVRAQRTAGDAASLSSNAQDRLGTYQ